MREELDLSWDDVRAEAEQRNVGQTVNQNRHFGTKGAMKGVKKRGGGERVAAEGEREMSADDLLRDPIELVAPKATSGGR